MKDIGLKELALDRQHRLLTDRFPRNPYIHRLVQQAEQLNVTFAPSPIKEQWLYEPQRRVIYLWEPDLANESLSFLVVILAHELGHVVDFDLNPSHVELMKEKHWFEAPVEIEIAAFVQGYRIIQDLSIPVNLDQYIQMIDPAIASDVRVMIEKDAAIR